ncbi:hypothetical protein Noda2021_01220 [Candidatus Dependentiae bacterium Noda2021]|nr:hypothetical protein Noda2021_01220 [Candidatus Dependentiae bacterium Noda2021]
MKKKLVLLVGASSLLLNYPTHATTHEFPDVTLKSDVIKIIDNFPLGIDVQAILKFLNLRQSLKNMLYGIKENDGTYIGIYIYENEKRSIESLIELEQALLASPSLTQEQTNQLMSIKSVLAQAKKDFLEKSRPLMEDAQGAKQPMIMLMKEWAQKANRKDSYILRWSTAKEGEETTYFEQNVTNLTLFKTFAHDLIHFLETLIKSCPKACDSFKDFLKKQHHKTS